MAVLPCDVPATGADASVFIDIIGVPLTPLLFPGAGRCAYRRLTGIDASPRA
jgi:hypothetical protein